MPNQLNFPERIDSSRFSRPPRLTSVDMSYVFQEDRAQAFGTHPNDRVELWLYAIGSDQDPRVISLAVTDQRLQTVLEIDNDDETFQQRVALNLQKIFADENVPTGRYAVVMNFFRREVGSPTGDKLVITQISPDRTEILLEHEKITPSNLAESQDFAQPGAPRFWIVGLLDQVFGRSLNISPSDVVVNLATVTQELDVLSPNMTARMTSAAFLGLYQRVARFIIRDIREEVIRLLLTDPNDRYVQDEQLRAYLRAATAKVLNDYKIAGVFDKRLNFT